MQKFWRPLAGWGVLLALWFVISFLELINTHILPTPWETWNTFLKMLAEPNPKYDLWTNIVFSVKINFIGYIEAVLIAIPVGFALGLNERIRQMFSMPIDAIRFIPITALGGLFVALFGFTTATKFHFLAFGILFYLIPVTVQRIAEVNPVHLQMMQTLGATKFQTFRYVQWPYVTSRLSDDIRILVAASWTYIIVAELKNITYGLGSLIFLSERRSSVEMVYVILIIIVTIGMLQDRLFRLLDWLAFRFKHE